jgi:hypothetical protein
MLVIWIRTLNVSEKKQMRMQMAAMLLLRAVAGYKMTDHKRSEYIRI